MIETIDLASMDVKEKIMLMEKLWNDLINSGDYKSPNWHNKVLLEREKQLKEGKEKFVDWEDAKKNLKK